MKKITCRLVFSIITISGMSTTARAQRNDAALWENIYLEKNLSTSWNLHVNHEGRINQNITDFYYAYGDFGLTYKRNKHVHLAFDYVYIQKKVKYGFWTPRHQAYIALTLKQKLGFFTISDRIMPQVQYTEAYSEKKNVLSPVDYYIRNKVTIKFNHINRFTYYAAAELYYKLNMPYGQRSNRMRYFAGVFYELNKMDQLELYYLFEQHYNIINPPQNFVIGIGVAHTFY